MPRVTLPDGSVKEFDGPAVTARQVAASIGAGLAKAAVGAKVDGVLVDLDRPIDHDVQVAIVTRPRKGTPLDKQDPDALYLLRHSTAHVMAEAIQRLWPDTLLAYGPPLDNGFYYDIALDTPISSDDFDKIEAEMKKIVEENRTFTRYELDPDAGMARLKDEGNKYKIDNAERAIDGGATTLSWYVTGEVDKNWEDLCMGPHVPATSDIGAFKVMSIASSNWHGDVESDRFQRVYGTAFYTQDDLDKYLEQLNEAKQRDHRVLGKKLHLFHIDEMVGQGLILWTPNGAIVRQVLQDFISSHLRRQGYSQVFTPHIGKLDLYKTSGHFPYYQDSQYPPLVERETLGGMAAEGCSCGDLANRMRDGEIDGYLLKPMNCPHHIKIYDSQPRSYRDLPIRLAEFGTVYRWEQSGEIGGMTRVRGFTQDDAHLFVTEDQLEDEVMGCLELVKIVFQAMGMTDYRVRVGLRDPDDSKYVGKPENWDKAEAACRKAAESLGVPFSAEPGEAAFYGPKIDFVVKDVIGRDWQLGTVQVDYNLPERFDLSYIGSDNAAHRPIMIHRAPFGSMERFIGCLIEHFAGAFPLWLAPEQMRVLPISDKFMDYAKKVHASLKVAGFRADLDDSPERLQAKIRNAQEMQVPYMLIVGGKDAEAGTVSIRDRRRGDLGALPVEKFIESAQREANTHGAESVEV
ncbi:MAG: threonine--tRNA ligase [Phycisphaera sp.]|nr:threonine--tRNA ligase [Phycisphaera sp.]